MFSVDKRGERCWIWGRRSYRAPFPQTELVNGANWSLHFRKSYEGWTSYRLYTSGAGAKNVWSLSVGNGVFARCEDYRILRDNHPEVLKWLMEMASGKPSPFPEKEFFDFDWERLDRVRLGKKEPIVNKAFVQMLEEIKTANRKGYRIGLGSDDSVNLIKVMNKNYGVEADRIRDFVNELMAIKALKVTVDGLRLVEDDPVWIRREIEKTGMVNIRV